MNENKLFQGITLLGLGPGDASQMTRSAWRWLESIPEVYLRTAHHPAAATLPKTITIHSFDEIHESGESSEDMLEKIVERILELGTLPAGVTYAVPGHPLVAEAAAPAILKRARQRGIPVRIMDGLSFLEQVFSLLNIDPFDGLILADAVDIARVHHPKFPPSHPVIISQIYSREVASDVKLTLIAVYPDEYPVKMVHNAGTSQAMVEDLALYEIDRNEPTGLMSVLYLPPMDENSAFEKFQDVIAHLRAPEGCPWDREQTHQSLRSNLLEETYEALHALDQENSGALMEELGDILLQVVLHAQIASEFGEFNMADIIRNINEKIIRRHPHVFSTEEVESVANVLQNWEELKQQERDKKNNGVFKGMLDGVPSHFPALAQAQALQARAARVGFDWEGIEAVWLKVNEELEEIRQAKNLAELEKEYGDLLFAVVNLVRWVKLDAESVLRKANSRFRWRFEYIEQAAGRTGKSMKDMTLAEMDAFWEEAKRLEQDEEEPDRGFLENE